MNSYFPAKFHDSVKWVQLSFECTRYYKQGEVKGHRKKKGESCSMTQWPMRDGCTKHAPVVLSALRWNSKLSLPKKKIYRSGGTQYWSTAAPDVEILSASILIGSAHITWKGWFPSKISLYLLLLEEEVQSFPGHLFRIILSSIN